MKQVLTSICLCCLTVMIASCNSINKNRDNIDKIEIGMTKQQVLDIMGEPLKNESYHKPNIWFYHTDRKWMDGVITRDECTPIVFDEIDMVVGRGFEYYKKNILFR